VRQLRPADGAVQGKVSVAHQDASGFAVRRIADDAQAGADPEAVVAEVELAGHGLQQILARLFRPLDGRLFQQDHELVTAETGHESRFRQACTDALGDGDQQQIAVLVPQRVIHVLEVIQIQQQHGAGRIRPGARHRPVELVVERPAVRQAGQVVVSEHALHLTKRSAHRIGIDREVEEIVGKHLVQMPQQIGGAAHFHIDNEE
jgi:hypothetical protein